MYTSGAPDEDHGLPEGHRDRKLLFALMLTSDDSSSDSLWSHASTLLEEAFSCLLVAIQVPVARHRTRTRHNRQ
jgi:hypothetical protein